MTEEQLAAAAERLAIAQEKFVEGCRLFVEAQMAVVQRIRHFEDFLQTSQALQESRDDETKLILEALRAMIAALVDSNLTLGENNERMNKLITKVESYFGNGEGLNFEN
ncbi:MAG: hypothetical protein QOH41_1544 [Blastocatellia bacterium]|jgi:hypothetical protein|nr:hypothetical protein [Blastocatellia bacterium]